MINIPVCALYVESYSKCSPYSVKPLGALEEKVFALGFEPVGQTLPSARSKSGNNMVH